jgi:predicted phosphodiesterase
MRIAAISDVHGNLTALDAVMADIETQNVDVVVNSGTSCPAWCSRGRPPTG